MLYLRGFPFELLIRIREVIYIVVRRVVARLLPSARTFKTAMSIYVYIKCVCVMVLSVHVRLRSRLVRRTVAMWPVR